MEINHVAVDPWKGEWRDGIGRWRLWLLWVHLLIPAQAPDPAVLQSPAQGPERILPPALTEADNHSLDIVRVEARGRRLEATGLFSCANVQSFPQTN